MRCQPARTNGACAHTPAQHARAGPARTHLLRVQEGHEAGQEPHELIAAVLPRELAGAVAELVLQLEDRGKREVLDRQAGALRLWARYRCAAAGRPCCWPCCCCRLPPLLTGGHGLHGRRGGCARKVCALADLTWARTCRSHTTRACCQECLKRREGAETRQGSAARCCASVPRPHHQWRLWPQPRLPAGAIAGLEPRQGGTGKHAGRAGRTALGFARRIAIFFRYTDSSL